MFNSHIIYDEHFNIKGNDIQFTFYIDKNISRKLIKIFKIETGLDIIELKYFFNKFYSKLLVNFLETENKIKDLVKLLKHIKVEIINDKIYPAQIDILLSSYSYVFLKYSIQKLIDDVNEYKTKKKFNTTNFIKNLRHEMIHLIDINNILVGAHKTFNIIYDNTRYFKMMRASRIVNSDDIVTPV